MTTKRTIRQVAVAVLLLVAFLFQGTWALAGTTGGLSGTVTDAHGKAVADAAVKVSSASQVSSTKTDASGHFVFLSLAPDTYTVSISKDGFQTSDFTGVSIFADQQQQLAFTLQPQLKTIASTTSRAAGSLVKSGVGADIYNVSASAIQATTALGGGGNLNSAYSAISSVPGVNVPVGGMGWNQATYIRGSQGFFSGFEYDGIPVNRAFDNYNASTESNLGLQELEVYTGGGPAANSSSGTSGFVNQVIKTGTYPGFGTLEGGIGGPTFYHQAKVEAGGSTPDRRFSYYVGISGYNQGFRELNNSNGANLMTPGQVYSGYSLMGTWAELSGLSRSEAPLCNPGTATDPLATNPAMPWYGADLANTYGAPSNCLIPYAAGTYGSVAQIADRENVANFHFRIPRANGLSDDLQVLWSASSLNTQVNSSPNDAGGYGPYTLAVTGAPYCAPGSTGCAPNYPYYVDATVYNAPFGTPIAGLKTQSYYQPSSSTSRSFNGELPANLRDGVFNDTGIVKLQYTHELSSNAYVRAFGYTFFSDWTQAGANSAYNAYSNYGVGPVDYGYASANYDLITHTAGGELQFADQINAQNLVELTGNYTTANVMRYNNSGYTGGASPIGLISDNGGKFGCYDPTTGASEFCIPHYSYQSNSVAGPTGNPPPGSPAALAGAQWVTLWNGNSSGSLNTVRPDFAFVSLSDQWRPSDRLMFNLSGRFEDYTYNLPNQANLATEFYADIIPQAVCVNSAGSVYSYPLAAGEPPPAPAHYTATCPTGYSHPAFSANSPTSYTIKDVSPRFSATYTESPDTVWRVSAGRFTEPPISASVQYLSSSGNELSVWQASLPLGFDSPFHPIPAMSASNYDLSLERHIRGTDISFKISPFYDLTNGYQEQNFIGANFVTQAPVGQFRSEGVELGISKGDFARDGLSGELSLTYTKAQVRFQNYYNNNQFTAVNYAIGQYNLLTKSGGGCPYYQANNAANQTAGIAGACVVAGTAPPTTAILNPYYSSAPQGAIDPTAWYAPANLGISPTSNPTQSYYDSPLDATLILNYRKKRFAITPSIQVAEGSSYGGPLDVSGYDPRVCGQNSGATGANITAASPNTNPYQCDYLTAPGSDSLAASQLFIPNPQTGSFATPGQYRNPWIMVGNLSMSYQVSSKVTANLTVANLFHTCFGGSKEPWTSAYPAGANFCGYYPTSAYVSNFYNGTSANDKAANGITPYAWQTQSYAPATFSYAGSIPSPLNVYFTLDVRL